MPPSPVQGHGLWGNINRKRPRLIPEEPRQTPAERVLGVRHRVSPTHDPEPPVALSDHSLKRRFVQVIGTSFAVLFLAWGLSVATGITGLGGLPGLGGDKSASSASHGHSHAAGPRSGLRHPSTRSGQGVHRTTDIRHKPTQHSQPPHSPGRPKPTTQGQLLQQRAPAPAPATTTPVAPANTTSTSVTTTPGSTSP